MLAIIEKGDWLHSFDWKAGYHHVDICESYQTFGFFLQVKKKKKKKQMKLKVFE